MRALAVRRAVLATLAAALLLPAAAIADPPPACPDAPADYTGSDPVVSELRLARVDERAACLATTGRLDRAHDDAAAAHDDSTAAATAAHTDATALQTHVDTVTDAVHAIPTPDASPTGYDGPTAARAGELADTLHVDVRGLQWLAWFLAGLLCVVIVRPSVSRWWAQ